MARNREALILVIDVGPSMHNAIPEIEKVCSLLAEKKLIYHKSDEVGVVLFGMEGTKNELTTEVGGYENVVVERDVKVVDGDLVEFLERLPRGTQKGDFLDAVVVGMDMLIKKYGETMKGKKRLCLITNAVCPIKHPSAGSKEEQVTVIAQQMTVQGMKMESIVVRGGLIGEADKRITDENDQLLNIFSGKTRAKLVYVESPISLRGALRTRNISPVTIFRGDFEISPRLKIKVWVYKKTSEERIPTLKKYSDKAPPNDKFATHEVKVDYQYKSVDDPGKVVPPEQRVKGYRYGPQVVPISSAVWDAFKFKPEKGVKLLGFTDSSNILRHYYMKDVNYFIAEPKNTTAILAVSALARAMKEMNKVAILRCIWRQGQGSVIVGVLTPNVSDRPNIPDSFYFNVLPFAEDVREFQFPSISSVPPSRQPNEQQQEAADNFVRMLDLAPPGREEALQPDFTPNPILERFFHCLELKSKDPDAVVPPLDETLKKIAEPDPILLSQNKSVISAFRGSFEFKENPKRKKSKRLLKDKSSGSNEGDEFALLPDQPFNAVEHTSAVKVDSIGDPTLVQDFEAMVSRRDGPEWVEKALRDMKDKIIQLVQKSDRSDRDKYTETEVHECLIALRKACVLEQEPKEFNDFVHHLCKLCKEKNLSSFHEFLASKGLTLITKTEAVDSELTEDQVTSYLVKSES